jgi:N-6 DNA Methylase.
LGGETTINDNAQDAAAKTASGFVSRLYDLLQKQYKKEELTSDVLHQLNVFCVRVVFCLYADDEEIFDDGQFHSFLSAFSAKQLNNKFKWLFIALDKEKRPESYDPEILAFPRVNGGLFKNEVPVPRISEDVKTLLLNASEESQMKGKDSFDWSEISPTNFGCIFESTLDPVTREENGMHYTSPENIHRVIDPLFLNDLSTELNSILNLPHENKKEKDARNKSLQTFQNKIARLHFLDPACGSGNFLTETFKSLRRLEMKIIAELPNCGLGDDAIKSNGVYLKNPCKVSIRQFYGIEINDFATQVANTALWISDCQMIAEAEELFSVSIPTLPLKNNDNIRCGNALETNWEDVINPRSLDYIIGNPPFKGARGGKDSKEEKEKEKG